MLRSLLSLDGIMLWIETRTGKEQKRLIALYHEKREHLLLRASI